MMIASNQIPLSRRTLARTAAWALVLAVFGGTGMSAMRAQSAASTPARVPVVFAGGYDTEGRDRGRPVVLIAAALGLPPEVFREAFTHVHPAGPGSGGPTDAEARSNKAALMSALGPYGITNGDRLDAVSNHYRYVRERGERWPTKSAVAFALVANGKITGFEIEDGGTGYTSPPTVTVPGFPDVKANVRLAFGKEFERNGSVAAIALPLAAGN